MKAPILAALVLAGLSAQALAQSDHTQHHPGGATQSQAAPSGPQAVPPASQAAPSGSQAAPARPQAGGPMMQGMPGMMGGMRGHHMGGMMGGGMMGGGAMGGGAMSGAAAAQGGDQSVSSLALRAVNDKMHRDMAIELTGNPDIDFARAMIAHHQGAVDMAKIVIAFGKDPDIRKLAEDVVRTQEAEITVMQTWLAKQSK